MTSCLQSTRIIPSPDAGGSTQMQICVGLDTSTLVGHCVVCQKKGEEIEMKEGQEEQE